MKIREIRCKTFRIGGGKALALVAGPCVIENPEMALRLAERLSLLCKKHGIPYLFKSSYDKANRSSGKSYRGPGLKKGLDILKEIKKIVKCDILTDVHCITQVEAVSEVADVIQIPAFLCRQTDLIAEVAKTGKVVNIKKGQFMAPWDMKNVIEKIEAEGNKKIMITERGTSFGYNNLVSDFRSIMVMKEYGYPVIYDATHSVQLPGGQGNASGGERKYIKGLALAGIAAGADGLFIEVHENPDKALCDGPNSIPLKDVESLLKKAKAVFKTVSS